MRGFAVAPERAGTGSPPPPGALARRLATGAVAKLLGETVARLASFAIVLWAARALGPTEFGIYLYGLGAGFVLAQGADLGLQLLITREVATHGKAAASLIRLALRVKLILAGTLALVLLPVAAGRPPFVQFALIALGGALLAQTFTEFAAHVFRGHEQLGREVGLLTATRLSVAVGCALVLWMGGGLVPFSFVILGANVGGCGVAIAMLRRAGWLDGGRSALSPPGPRLPARVGPLVREALPLGLAVLFSAAYLRAGWILLSLLVGDDAVAQLGVAQRLTEAAQLLPAAVIAAVFPAYTRALWAGGPGARRIGPSSGVVLAALGLLAAATLWWTADRVVPLLFGPAYIAAIPVLRVLALAIPLMFLNYLLTHLVIARGLQRLIAWFAAASLGLHLVLCWILIPRYGTLGVAASIIAAEALLFVLCSLALRSDPSSVSPLAQTAVDPAEPAGVGVLTPTEAKWGRP